MSSEWSIEFMEANHVSLEIAAKIEKVLKFNGLASLITVVNSMSLSLKLPEQLKQLNSTLCVSQKGSGKSTLLIHILAKSNPQFFQILPKKMFESQLLENPKDYFHNKILVHDDITIALGGTNKKQREQLTGFFTLLLSDGTYSRNDKQLYEVNCMCHFGIAQEAYIQHRKELLDSTFLDRFATYSVKLDSNQKLKVLQHRDVMINDNVLLPKIKLPLTKKRVEVRLHLTNLDKNRINSLAMELDSYGVLSFTRAQNYIKIFLLSNALLNNRRETSVYDLELYEMLHPYHQNSVGKLSKKDEILGLIKRFPSKTDEELIEISGVSRATFYRLKGDLRIKCEGKVS